MSQSYSSNCFSTANVIETDMTNIENNFDALRSMFSGSSAPASPDPGQLWFHDGTGLCYIRTTNSSWHSWFDVRNDRVATGKVKTHSFAPGCLTTDSTGRAIMAPGYITSSHVDNVDVTKITNLNKSAVIMSSPLRWTSASSPDILVATGTTKLMGRVYIPNTGANKLKMTGFSRVADVDANPSSCILTVGTSAVTMGVVTTGNPTTYFDTATYIDVTAWLGTVQSVSIGLQGGNCHLAGFTLYLTT